MDIAYKPDFSVSLYINPTISDKCIMLDKWSNNEDFDSEIEIEENDELDLLFECSDSDARLYFEALECCPKNQRIKVDEDEGIVYCCPGRERIALYRSDKEYDALRVDCVPIIVKCNGESFFSKINIIPKQLSRDEWNIMRDDIEEELKGLSQDIVRRNIGIGKNESGHIPPETLYSFLIIEKYSKAVMAALLDIKDKPYYKIVSKYYLEDEAKAKNIDSITIKHYLKKGYQNNSIYVPKKEVVYDIQENRLLKKILKLYENKLNEFIKVVEDALAYCKDEFSKRNYNKTYAERCISNLLEYLENAKKLKKVSNILKQQDWFKSVGNVKESTIPHSFAMDSRYGTIYRMYTDFNKENFEISFDSKYAYSWKKSSSLYEIWCYLKVCRSLLEDFSLVGGPFESSFVGNQLFPFLESGTFTTMENDIVKLEVIYDKVFPNTSTKAKSQKSVLYFTGITGRHFRPDVCINIYAKDKNLYIGSVVIECKYRKLNAFWTGDTWSSKEQIIAYVNDSKSEKLYGGKKAFRLNRPVNSVFVFTPDKKTNVNSIEARDNNIFLTTFKPSTDENYEEIALKNVKAQIEELIEQYEELAEFINI